MPWRKLVSAILHNIRTFQIVLTASPKWRGNIRWTKRVETAHMQARKKRMSHRDILYYTEKRTPEREVFYKILLQERLKVRHPVNQLRLLSLPV